MARTSKSVCYLWTFLLCVCHLQYFCSGRDNVSAGNWIHEGRDEIVSPSNIFRMGFFTPPGNSSKDRKYVGIWYCNSSEVIVWVANREAPIPSNVSGRFGIDIKRGNLEVSDSGNTRTYFSTNVRSKPQYNSRTAKLYDNGNLVLIDDPTGETLWESFENPTDTFLPGMKMDGNLNLTSWKSDEDPAPGNFSFQLAGETGGGYFIMKSDLLFKHYWESGGESTNSFILTLMNPAASLLLSNTTSNTNERFGNISDITKRLSSSRLFMQSTGKIKYFTWDSVEMRWSLLWSEPEGPCSVFQACGSYARCNPDPHNHTMALCTCLPGFEPTNKEHWKPGDFSGGCKKKFSECKPGNTSFVKLNVIMVRSNTPVFKDFSKDKPNSTCQEECTCQAKCQKECDCQAYSYYIDRSRRNDKNRGCWFWSDNLDDIQEGSDGDHILFFRVDPPSDNDLGPSSPASVGNQLRKSSSPPTLRRVIIISATVIFAVGLLCSLTCIYRRIAAKRKDRNIKKNQALQLYDNEDLVDQDNQFGEDDKKDIDVPFFEFESIVDATDNFSKACKLGEGGFGPVYKGNFPGGEEIAVKRLSSNSGQGFKEFKNEVVLIAKLQHRNLVRLLGYCIKGKEKILLYECMPNKSLDAFIFDSKLSMLLNWATRFDIIVGVARGLLYLHQDSRLRIIHRDMKASNILLDDEMNPKISDFGLARIVGRRDTESNTTRVIGTYGYMAPEYALEGQFSVKSDAFSFGVVVLEIISGKKNTGFFDSQIALSLLGYAWNLWKEEKPLTLLDEMLVGSCNNSEVLKCITVGLLCVQEDPKDRPDMSKVVFMLSGETETLPNPKQPAFVTRKRFDGTTSSSTKLETQSKNEITFSEEDGR